MNRVGLFFVAACLVLLQARAQEQCPESWELTLLGGSFSGDPHFTGFYGQRFEFTGQPGNVYSMFSTAFVQANALMIPNMHQSKTGTYVGAISLVTAAGDVVLAECKNSTFTTSVNGKVLRAGEPTLLSSASNEMMVTSTKTSVTVGSSSLGFQIEKHRSKGASCYLNLDVQMASAMRDYAVRSPQAFSGVLGETLRTPETDVFFKGNVGKYYDGLSVVVDEDTVQVKSGDILDTQCATCLLGNADLLSEIRPVLYEDTIGSQYLIGSNTHSRKLLATIVCQNGTTCVGDTCVCDPGSMPGNGANCDPCPDPCYTLVECDGFNVWEYTCSGISGVTIRTEIIELSGGGGGYRVVQEIEILGGGMGGLTEEEILHVMGSGHGASWVSPINIMEVMMGGASGNITEDVEEGWVGGGGITYRRNVTYGGGGFGGDGLLEILGAAMNNPGPSFPVDIEIKISGGGGGSYIPEPELEFAYGGGNGSTIVLTEDPDGWYRTTVMPSLYWCEFNVRFWGGNTLESTVTQYLGGGAVSGGTSLPPGPCDSNPCAGHPDGYTNCLVVSDAAVCYDSDPASYCPVEGCPEGPCARRYVNTPSCGTLTFGSWCNQAVQWTWSGSTQQQGYACEWTGSSCVASTTYCDASSNTQNCSEFTATSMCSDHYMRFLDCVGAHSGTSKCVYSPQTYRCWQSSTCNP